MHVNDSMSMRVNDSMSTTFSCQEQRRRPTKPFFNASSVEWKTSKQLVAQGLELGLFFFGVVLNRLVRGQDVYNLSFGVTETFIGYEPKSGSKETPTNKT